MKYNLKWLRKHFSLAALDLVEKELRELYQIYYGDDDSKLELIREILGE